MLIHLLEIRRRAVIVLIVFICFFLMFFVYASELFHFIVKPLINSLPGEDSLIATQITSPVFIPLSLAADVALLCTAPVALLQLWRFVAPGLYKHERYPLKALVIGSVGLFLTGVIFCFYIVLPFMFKFFANAIPAGVKMMPDMASALSFITHMLLLFGFCFQVPLICLTLVRFQWIDVQLLRKIRPYIIVAAFTIGMLLTPPDVLSQVMLAIPLCLLYELGIVLSLIQTSKFKTPVSNNIK